MVKHVSEYGANAVDAVRKDTPADRREVPGPSENPATNIILADIAMRAGSYVVRDAVAKGLLRGRYGSRTASDIIANKSLGQTAISFALAKIATRSLPGAIIVGGGAAAKILFDRSQKRRRARRTGDRELLEQAHGDD